jgi:hypothetical protein
MAYFISAGRRSQTRTKMRPAGWVPARRLPPRANLQVSCTPAVRCRRFKIWRGGNLICAFGVLVKSVNVIGQVVTVSLETLKTVASLPEIKIE